MAPKNKKTLQKNTKTVSKSTKKPTKSNQKVKSIIKTLEGKNQKSKTDFKDVVDKVLLVVMIAQLLFLVYYFMGY